MEAAEPRRRKRSLLLHPGVLAFLALPVGWILYWSVGMSAHYQRKVSDTQAMSQWDRYRTEYQRLATNLAKKTEGEQSLPPGRETLTEDGTAFVERMEDGRTMVTFTLDEWGLDNSIALVHITGKVDGIKSSVALEEWYRHQKLADSWYIVEGT